VIFAKEGDSLSDKEPSAVKSALRVLEIFELLSENPGGLTIQEISTMLKIPQSSTFSLVQTLSSKSYLHLLNSKKYRLGHKLIAIGTSVLESLDMHTVAQPFLQELMEQVRETVFMAALLDGEMVYVLKIDSNRSIRTNAQIGSRKPLYCTGLGKSFLANMSSDEVSKVLSHNQFEGYTKNTVTDMNELQLQLQSFRQLGYSIDDEEIEEGLSCFAAPIFNWENKNIAAISVAGPKERVFGQKDYIVKSLLETADLISKNFGYKGALTAARVN
jgi:DNA-binding IclR family transcriptional regulator